MSKLYLIRHAEPELTGVLLGSCDPPLSEAGKRDARAIYLPEVVVIYTSALRRARETAHAIATCPAVVDPDLNEISYGAWDGLSWSSIVRQFPAEADAKLANWTAVTPPGGEDWVRFVQRVARAERRIRAGLFPAAVVAHVTVNAVLAHILSGTEPSDFTQEYGEVVVYDL
jgi:broad specificity phosphatase PhoE